jgi:hypothetical protein
MSFSQINNLIGHCSPLMLRDIVMLSDLSHKEKSILIDRLVDDYLQSTSRIEKSNPLLDKQLAYLLYCNIG